MMIRRWSGTAALAGAMMTAGTPAWALEWNVTADYTAAYNSNAQRVEEDEEWELTHTPALGLAVNHIEDRYQVEGDYSIQRQFYTQDEFGDRTVTVGYAGASADVIPETFIIDASNRRTLATIDAFEVNTPDNQQEIDQTDLGATLQRTFGRNTASVRYALNTYAADETENDVDTEDVTVSLLRELSRSRTLELQGVRTNGEFSEQSLDADQSTVTLTYTGTTRRLTLALMGGYRTSEIETLSESKAPIYSVSANYLIRDQQAVTLTYRRTQDYRSGFDLGDVIVGDDGAVIQDTNRIDVFVEDAGNLGYQFVVGRNAIALNLRGQRRRYEQALGDNQALGVQATLDRPLGSRTTLTAAASFDRVQDDEVGPEDDDILSARASLNWLLRPRIPLSLRVGYDKRDGQIDWDGYTVELQIGMTLWEGGRVR